MVSPETFQSTPEPVYVHGYPISRYNTVQPWVLGAWDSRRLDDYYYNDRIEALDIGGFRNNPVVKQVFPTLRTIALNIPDEYHGRIGDLTYDGFRMPLGTDSIPVVMAVDVLEQVHPDSRLKLIEEMARIAKERVVIACPFESAENAVAEEFLLDKMREAGLPEKRSIRIHRNFGLPRMTELVTMARKIGLPFEIWPATDRELDFQGLLNQVEILGKKEIQRNSSSTLDFIRLFQLVEKLKSKKGKLPSRDKVELANQIAAFDDLHLRNTAVGNRPTWDRAYRAVLIIDKVQRGRILENESDYIFGSDESTVYGLAFSRSWYESYWNVPHMVHNLLHGNESDWFAPDWETAPRGFTFGFEGPDGSGKTETIAKVAEILAEWGYIVATPMKYGPRQRLREMERRNGAIINQNQREALLAYTTSESMITANAHKLRGPCNISLADRTLASTNNIYHPMHGTDEGATFALESAYTIPPDMTFLLGVSDFEKNWTRKSAKGDLANAEITREDLRRQRELYNHLEPNRFTGPIVRISSDGSVDETANKVLDAIEEYFGISTRRKI